MGKRTAAVLVASAMALSACTGRGTDAGSTTPSASVSSSASTQPATSSATPTPSDVPVAGYVPGDHEIRSRYTSPDRVQMTSPARPKGFAEPPAGKGMDRYLGQKVEWRGCDGRECAKVLVPLDWDDPDGPAITLALRRAKASKQRIGTLFINPGGPGVAAQDMVDQLPPEDFPRHDIVAWDTRGSGESTPVQCGAAVKIDELTTADASPDDEAEWKRLIEVNKAFAQACRTHSGALLDHVSSIDTARDLDYLRHLVGDEKLNYLGISYGTAIGAVYAELYPSRVGRMVLDSAVNITDDESVSQAGGFEKAVHTYARWCAQRNCAGLGRSEKQVVAAITKFMDDLDVRPVPAGKRQLTQSQALTGLLTLLYGGEQTYQLATVGLEQARSGNGIVLLTASDMQNGRKRDGSYDPSVGAFPAIGCRDSADGGLSEVKAYWKTWSAKAPLVGRLMGPGLQCVWWTARPDDQLVLRAKGAAPILVLGVTGDPATPYQQAIWMADQLDSGTLLSWKGEGHSAFFLGNKCVKDAVHGYLDEGKVPADRTVC